jgi:hypothetical protein
VDFQITAVGAGGDAAGAGVAGTASAGDVLRNLRGWLLDEPDFRGRATLREAPARPGHMGPAVDALLLAFAGGGGAALGTETVRMLGGVLVAWLKARTSPVEVTVRRADGAEVTLSADDVRGLSADGVARMLDDLTLRLGPPSSDGRDGHADHGGWPGADTARSDPPVA